MWIVVGVCSALFFVSAFMVTRGYTMKSQFEGLFGILMALVVVAIAISSIRGCYNSAYPPLDVRMTGQIEPGLISDHAFKIRLWHQNPGTVTNGRMSVRVQGSQLKLGAGQSYAEREYSFDEWRPNQDAVREFSFPLNSVGEQVDLTVTISINAKGTQNYWKQSRWYQNRWQ